MIYLNKKNQIAQGAALIGAAFLTLALQAQEYVMDPDWPKPLPENIEWGQVPNVTIDREGFIYAFHRSDPPVLKFDTEGNLVDSFGSAQWVARPHGFRLTPEGDIWTTDYQRESGHTITKSIPQAIFCCVWAPGDLPAPVPTRLTVRQMWRRQKTEAFSWLMVTGIIGS